MCDVCAGLFCLCHGLFLYRVTCKPCSILRSRRKKEEATRSKHTICIVGIVMGLKTAAVLRMYRWKRSKGKWGCRVREICLSPRRTRVANNYVQWHAKTTHTLFQHFRIAHFIFHGMKHTTAEEQRKKNTHTKHTQEHFTEHTTRHIHCGKLQREDEEEKKTRFGRQCVENTWIILEKNVNYSQICINLPPDDVFWCL